MVLVAAWAVMTAVLGVASARGAFPGQNGKVVFQHFDGADSEIFAVDASGENEVGLTDNAVGDNDPAVSPDGEKVAFVRNVGGDSEIFVMDADGQNQVPLTDNSLDDFRPAFSPDGQRIAFDRFDGGDDEIFVMDANGQNQIPLTDNAVADLQAVFSPDSQRIAFVRQVGDFEIFTMDATGQNQMPLTDNSVTDFEPAWSPDGQRIGFRHFDGSDTEIFAIDISGQNQVPLTDNSLSDSEPDWQPLNAPALDLSGPAKQKSAKFVTVTASSQNEDATVALGGTVQVPTVKTSAQASKKKSFELTPQTVELQPGQPVTVSLAVPKKARKLLKRAFAAGKKGAAAVTATATDDLGASSQDSQAVKLKKKPKK